MSLLSLIRIISHRSLLTDPDAIAQKAQALLDQGLQVRLLGAKRWICTPPVADYRRVAVTWAGCGWVLLCWGGKACSARSICWRCCSASARCCGAPAPSARRRTAFLPIVVLVVVVTLSTTGVLPWKVTLRPEHQTVTVASAGSHLYEVVQDPLPPVQTLLELELVSSHPRHGSYRPVSAEEAAPWQARQVYRLYWGDVPMSQYLILWPGRVVEIFLDDDPTETQMATVAAALAPPNKTKDAPRGVLL